MTLTPKEKKYLIVSVADPIVGKAIADAIDRGGSVIEQETLIVGHDEDAEELISHFAFCISGTGIYLGIAGKEDNVPPIIGSTFGSLILPVSFPFLDGILPIQESASPPGTAVELYVKTNAAVVGQGRSNILGQLYATSPGTFIDNYGREYKVIQTTSPETNPELSPLFVNPEADDPREYITAPGAYGSIAILADQGGFFYARGNANTLNLLFDPSSPQESALYYDDGGTGEDIEAISGVQDSSAGGSNLSPYVVVSSLYFDETIADESMRLYHRFPLFQKPILIKLTNGMCITAQYDASGTKGKKLYYENLDFPAQIKANLDSEEDSIIKTSADIRFFQES